MSKGAAKGKTRRYVKICPQCGSVEIRRRETDKTPEEFICDSCSYISHIFPEVREDRADYFREHIVEDRHRSLNRLLYGGYAPNLIAKIGGPSLFFFGMLLLLMLQEYTYSLMYPFGFIIIGLIVTYIAFLGGRRK